MEVESVIKGLKLKYRKDIKLRMMVFISWKGLLLRLMKKPDLLNVLIKSGFIINNFEFLLNMQEFLHMTNIIYKNRIYLYTRR